MWSSFKTAHHNFKMTISKNPRAATAPLQTSLYLNNLLYALPSTCPCSSNSKTTLKHCKQHPNLLCPKNATYTQTPPNFICTSHRCKPMQSTAPQSLYIKVHEETTKKCFGNKHPNLFRHSCGSWS
jgi:hypothetical protein